MLAQDFPVSLTLVESAQFSFRRVADFSLAFFPLALFPAPNLGLHPLGTASNPI